ncbi:MAG: TIM-barrel domain-containing protein, partial [Fidelibacterota bacterium]
MPIFIIILYLSLIPSLFAIEFVGDYSNHVVQDNTVLFTCGSTAVSIQLYRDDIVRVSLFPSGNIQDDTSFVVVNRSWPEVDFEVYESADEINIKTDSMIVTAQKRPFRLSFYDGAGRLILKERDEGGLGWEGELNYAYFQQGDDPHYYGFGEKSIPLDRRGYSFRIFNKPVFGYAGEEADMSINIPFFSTPDGYGIYFDNPYTGYFDMGEESQAYFYYRVDHGPLIYYFIYGSDFKTILEKYTWLTGRQPMPSRWALGYLQSKFGYENETEARAVVKTMRAKKIPCDAIILDVYWFGGPELMGNLSWDQSRWPDPQKMMADFRDVGIKTILIEEPYITIKSSNYWTAYYGGYFGTDSLGQSMAFDIWAGRASLLDLTRPSAQEWWWGKHRSLIDGGVAGWWTDLGEPETHPSDMRHYLGPMKRVHNIFNLIWSKLLYEGYMTYRPDERLFNLTRSGFAGMQRYSTFPWSGDVSKSFSGLRAQLPIMLGMGMSGVGYQHSDIGGFTGYTTPELYARWMEFGSFSPITRAHGWGQGTEPWAFGSEVEEIATDYIKLRYKLLPYIYTYAYQNHIRGWPLARPLIFEYPEDPAVLNLDSEYLWGEAFLAAPVMEEGSTSRSVYLPEGEWIDYWTGDFYPGSRTITVEAPLNLLPLFVKNGSIIPMQ